MCILVVEFFFMLDKEERRVKFINRNGKVLNKIDCFKIDSSLKKLLVISVGKKLIGDFLLFINFECFEF